MQKPTPTYTGQQFDDVERLLTDAERLISNPKTRLEGESLMRLASLKMQREKNRMSYAVITGQKPNIPPLEPTPLIDATPTRQLAETTENNGLLGTPSKI